MTRKLSFTPSMIDTLASGSLKDPQTPGLSIELLSSGKKVCVEGGDKPGQWSASDLLSAAV